MSIDDTTTAAQSMDAIYRRQRFIYDITRKYYLLGRDRMLAELEPPPGGHVLEIGCGTARNLLQAAALYPDAEFYGFDISEEMLKTAGRAIAASRYRDSIRIAQGDATAFDTRALFHLFAADRIFVSYALSMIPDWEKVIDRALSSLSARGELHIVDFGDMADMPEVVRRAMLSWLKRFSVTPRANLESAVRAAARQHGMGVIFHQTRLGYAAHARIGTSLV